MNQFWAKYAYMAICIITLQTCPDIGTQGRCYVCIVDREWKLIKWL